MATSLANTHVSTAGYEAFIDLPFPFHVPRMDGTASLVSESNREKEKITAISLYSAYALLATRYSRTTRITFAVNVLSHCLLELDVGKEGTVEELLRLVQSTIDFNATKSETSRAGPCHVSIQHGNTPKSEERNGTLDAPCGIAIRCDPGLENTKLEATYDSSIIDATQIQRMLQQLAHVIRQLSSAQPTAKLDDIETVSPEDRSQIMKWNRTKPQRLDLLAHELFFEHVRCTPDQVAISSWDGEMTYRELQNSTQQFAKHLGNLTVPIAQCITPICFEKSIWMHVAALSVLRAGGIVVPLDPSHPTDRLKGIMIDVKATLLIVSVSQAERFNSGAMQIITFGAGALSDLPGDSLTSEMTQYSPKIAISQNQTAFVFFTSGSTGQPKGIALSHAAICTSTSAHSDACGINRTTRILQFSSYAFDVSMYDMFAALANGASLIIPSEHDRINRLSGIIDEKRVNWVTLTSSVSNTLHPNDVPGLQTLVLTGESPTQENINTWAASVKLFNGYGSTEAPNSMLSRLLPGSSAKNIGYGVGARPWILDDRKTQQLAPIGALGRLYIEGPILAQGYLDDEAQTQASFVELTPKWLERNNDAPILRLYDMGDCARYRSDGSIEYCGREGAPVKIRGQRVELSEVEHQVKRLLPDHTQLVVEAVRIPIARNGAQSLAVFFETAGAGSTDHINKDLECIKLAMTESRKVCMEDLRASLATCLPSYMIPSLFVPLKKLPRLVSGKVNRNQLRHVAANVSEKELSMYSLNGQRSRDWTPSTIAEETLVKLWSNTLGFSRFFLDGEHDFFRLGGDSIAAMDIANEASRIGLILSTADVFRYSVLKDMAKLVENRGFRPKIGMNSMQIEPFSLMGQKRSLKAMMNDIHDQCGIEKASGIIIEDIYPCTTLQEGLMALSMKVHGSYVNQNVFRLPDHVDIEHFKSAWDAVVDSTDILRTRFVFLPNFGSNQVVLKCLRQPFIYHDDLKTYLRQDGDVHVEYGSPLSRHAIVKNSTDNRCYFIWTCHHATYDACSLPIILDKLRAAYDGRVVKASTPFKGFIKFLAQIDEDASDRFWQSTLAGSPSIKFPLNRSSLFEGEHTGRCEHMLRFRRRDSSAFTIPTILQAAWSIVCMRYMSSEDVVFGMTLSGRNSPVSGIADMAGPTVATIPFRAQTYENQRTADFLTSIRNRNIEMIPFEQAGMQDIRRLSTDADAACGFNTLLVIHPPDMSAIQEQGPDGLLEFITSNESVGETYPLLVQCWPEANSMKFEAQYDGNMTSAKAVKRILTQTGQVVERLLLETRDSKVGDIQLFGTLDKSLIRGWNTAVPEVVNRCVHDVIVEQSELHPDAPAVCGWDGNLTFRELDGLSTTLGSHLISLGVSKGDFVPILFVKSTWTIIAIMAIWKIGAAFVPLEGSQPKARTEEILTQVRPKHILGSPSYITQLSTASAHTLVIDEHTIRNLPKALVSVDPLNLATPDTDAYIIFTSGSTGKPKGVVIQHRACSSSIQGHGRALNISNTTRALQFASYSFDAIICEIFSPLSFGGCVCVPAYEDRMGDLAGFINRTSVNWAVFPTSVLKLISPEKVTTLKTLVQGGEAVDEDDIRIWADKVDFFNGYGPTETVCITVTTKLNKTSRATTIGKGAGSVCWIVEPDNPNRLAAVGTVGELLIQGPTLARGYFKSPIQTKSAFLESPKWYDGDFQKNGQRFYRTGDLVRYDDDGNIDCLGRKDLQIKLRGQRIELNEIEAHVKSQLPEAPLLVVELIKETDGAKAAFLAVFICFSDNFATGTEEGLSSFRQDMSEEHRRKFMSVEQYLRETLPSYMVPTLFLPLHKIPIMASGKLDRRIIRRLAGTFNDKELALYSLSTVEKRAVSDGMEEKITQIWSETLKIATAHIGADDHFFRIGGDSISAMRMSSIARGQAILLPVTEIFRCPRLCDMARAAQNTKHERDGDEMSGCPFSLVPNFDQVGTGIFSALKAQYDFDRKQVDDIYPCSPLQEGLMALSVTEAGYVANSVLRLPSMIDTDRFKFAWEAVVRAMPILRTRVVLLGEDSVAMQVVLHEEVEWGRADSLSDYLAHRKAQVPEYGKPLMSQGLVCDGSATHFVWTVSHVLYDGWSVSLISSMLSRAYQDLQIEQTPLFSGFIRCICKEVEKDRIVDFWRHELDGTEIASFPARKKAGYHVKESRTMGSSIPFCRNEHLEVTTSALLEAAWVLLVAEHSNSDDVCFGMTLTGRDVVVPGVESIVGPTICTIPVRIRIDRQQSVSSFLQGVQEHMTRLTPFQHAGLQNIRRLSEGARQACDFQILLIIQPEDDREESLFTLSPSMIDESASQTYPMLVECFLGSEEIKFEVRYDADIVTEERVQMTLYQLARIVDQLNEHSKDKRIADIDSCSEFDKSLIRQWNCAEKIGPVDRCLHEMFMEQARLRPQAQALCMRELKMTYSELDEYSSRMAFNLHQLGVGPEEMIALAFSKSAWAVVAMLGVLKAGAAFVMLDPTNPPKRLQEVIRRIRAKVLVTSSESAGFFAEYGVKVLTVDSTITGTSLANDALALTTFDPERLAYTMFTSGSTGSPKGVLISHKAVCTSLISHSKIFKISQGSRVFQFCAYTFDVCITEIFGTLIAGGCVCIPDENERLHGIAEAMNHMRVNWAFFTPSVVKMITPESVPLLQTLVLGGEAVPDDDVARWIGKAGLMNGYGPTEASIFSLVHVYSSNQSPSSTVGLAVGSTSWVVSPQDHQRLAPIGAVGELLIAGPILARGYLDDEAKTKAAFIENPAWMATFDIAEEHGRRLYKTGDLVRYHTDGTLIYLGRIDTQVKLHGQRIELGEIENKLGDDLDIGSAVVLLPRRGLCDRKLLAVVSKQSEGRGVESIIAAENIRLVMPGKEPTKDLDDPRAFVSKIRTGLSQQLPRYMLPLFIPVERIPLGPTDKIDRKDVATWVENLPQSSYNYIMQVNAGDATDPTASERIFSPTEIKLQHLLARILNIPIEEVTLEKTFIGLGGDSITAMQLVARCRAQGIVLHVSDVLRNEAISQLANRTNAVSLEGTASEERIGEEFDLSPMQKMYFRQTGNKVTRFNQSFLLRVRKRTCQEDLESFMDAIVQRHPMLRARLRRKSSSIWAQRISDDDTESFRMQAYDVLSEDQTKALVKQAQTSLDVERGPLIIAHLYNLEDGQQLLFMVAHHLVIDLVSWRIILSDLEDLMSSIPLLDPPLSFQAWCSLQQESVQRTNSRASASDLSIPPPMLEYWGMAGIDNVYADSITEGIALDQETTSLLLCSCHQVLNAELVDVILASLLHSFRKVFHDREYPPIFVEGHGREPWDEAIDLTRTVGWFTTIVPIVASLEDNNDIIGVVRSVKDLRRRLLRNGQAYFADKQLNPGSSLDDDTGMEILFNFIGQYQQLEHSEGLFAEVPTSLAGWADDWDGNDTRMALFDVSATVADGALKIQFTYNKNTKHLSRIGTWMHVCENVLNEAAEKLRKMPSEWTLSDFPLMAMGYSDLQRLRHHLTRLGVTDIANVDDVYPCSAIQQSMLESQCRKPWLYQIRIEFCVRSPHSGHVNVQRLIQAWQGVVTRHAALRTLVLKDFVRPGSYSQIVLKVLQAESSYKGNCGKDGITPGGDEAVTNEQCASRTQLHKLTLRSHTANGILAQLELSHVIVDAHSLSVIMNDLVAGYRGGITAAAPTFSEHIAKLLTQPQEEARKYWQTYLAGCRDCLILSSGAVLAHEHRTSLVRRVHIAAESQGALASSCKTHNTTASNLVQTVWALTLRQLLGLDEVVFGYVVSNRQASIAREQEMIGPLLNILVCRLHISSATTLSGLLAKIREDYLDSMPYQHCGMAGMVYDREERPLFNTLVNYRPSGIQKQPQAEDDLVVDILDAQDPWEVIDNLESNSYGSVC